MSVFLLLVTLAVLGVFVTGIISMKLSVTDVFKAGVNFIKSKVKS